jgi:hypothetical protein
MVEYVTFSIRKKPLFRRRASTLEGPFLEIRLQRLVDQHALQRQLVDFLKDSPEFSGGGSPVRRVKLISPLVEKPAMPTKFL